MRRRHVLAAPDKFRGSASALEVAQAVAEGAEQAGWTCTTLPLADGGEGTLDVFGRANRHTVVSGPLGEPVDAPWLLAPKGFAVVEAAAASGLGLAGGREGNDPLRATSRGTGELIAAAVAAGARRVLVALGGSAMTDGGLGAVEVLEDLAPFGSGGVDLVVACDVRTTFLDAADVFGPQKGAGPAEVAVLRDRLREIADGYLSRWAFDVLELPGAGAAGGLGGGLAVLGARLVPGLDLVAEHLGMPAALDRAGLVVTGEGRLDPSSFHGKVVGGVLTRARHRGLRTLVVAGAVDPAVTPVESGPVVSLEERFGQASWTDPAQCVTIAVRDHLQNLDLEDAT